MKDRVTRRKRRKGYEELAEALLLKWLAHVVERLRQRVVD